MAASPDAVLALASGVPLALLGAGLLAARPLRREPFFLGSFAILWGAQVVVANLGVVLGDPAVHRVALLAAFALLGPSALFLTYFAWMGSSSAAARWPAGLAAAAATAATAVLVVAPSRVVSAVAVRDGAVATTFGSLALPLFWAPFFAAFYLALAGLYRAYRRAAPGTPRHRARGLLLALALFTSYTTVRQLFVFIDPPPSVTVLGPATALGTAGLFLLGATFLAGLVVHLAARPPPPEERDRRLLAAFLVPAAVALAEVAIEPAGLRLETTGFWRIATVAALVYALARHQLFDLDLRLRRAVGPALAALALGYAALAAVALLVAGRVGEVALPLGAGAVVATGALAFRDRLGGALFPGARAETAYVRRRKLEVYKASLEELLAAGADASDARLLRLRRDLDISDAEHEVMAFLVADRRATPRPGPERVETGARIAGRYRVDRLLGEGGYGRAFLAVDETTGAEVVVKVVAAAALGGSAARSLEREARVLRGIRHPNVIRVEEVLDTGREVVLVLEYAAGGNLLGLLRRRGALPLGEAVRVLDGILAGLAAAHARGVVHRDVKPENVLLDGDGTPKVADFGIARESGPNATAGAGVAGTLLYMSPEQVRGKDVDERADLYAAAVVFHQVLTGKFYLRIAGKDDFQVRELIVESPPQLAVKDEPPWVAELLARALAKDPADRFPSAEAMREALRARAALAAAP